MRRCPKVTSEQGQKSSDPHSPEGPAALGPLAAAGGGWLFQGEPYFFSGVGGSGVLMMVDQSSLPGGFPQGLGEPSFPSFKVILDRATLDKTVDGVSIGECERGRQKGPGVSRGDRGAGGSVR